MSAKLELTRYRAPDEAGSEERTWSVVRRAYEQRSPARNRRLHRRAAAVLVAGVLLLGALVLSPAGATVGRLITRALGIQHAAPALFSLPGSGRLVLSGPRGTWTIHADGSTRRIGPWAEASWSPHGLYLAVVGKDGLAAVTPRGVPQWTLPRVHVRSPRWYPPTGFRVAYLTGTELRVVAGDGLGDHVIDERVSNVAPSWRPGHPYQLAYFSVAGRVVVRDADTGRMLWTVRQAFPVRKLAWSANGSRLLALSRREALVYGADGKLLLRQTPPTGATWADGSLSPGGRTLALVSGGRGAPAGSGGVLLITDLDRLSPAAHRVLVGDGLGQVVWSPDGRWLLVSWPAANQWVFVRVIGAPRIEAVSRIAQQFSATATGRFPRLEGWCCGPDGSSG